MAQVMTDSWMEACLVVDSWNKTGQMYRSAFFVLHSLTKGIAFGHQNLQMWFPLATLTTVKHPLGLSCYQFSHPK